MSASFALATGTVSLRDAWELRNAAAETLTKAEAQLRRLLETATADQVVGLLEAFSPARSRGPEWSRSFDPLVERLWTWCDPAVLASVKAEIETRGPAWAAIANSLAPERGVELRDTLGRGSAGARLPRFTLG
jgi:hypothetical protein